MADHFNMLDYAHQLESAGVPAPQAEVHAQALAQVLDRCLAIVADSTRLRSELLSKIAEAEAALRSAIKRVESSLREVEVRLQAEIREVEVTVRAEIKEVEIRLRAEIKEAELRLRAELGGRIDRLEERMNEGFRHQRWANGVIVAMQLGLFAMLAGLYFH